MTTKNDGHLSLKEAREAKRLGKFIQEHPSKGNEAAFDALLGAMVRTPEPDDQTSPKDDAAY